MAARDPVRTRAWAAAIAAARRRAGVALPDGVTAAAAQLIGRGQWRANGAMALRWTGDRFEMTAARPPGEERPWAPRLPEATNATTPSTRPAARDATPRAEDLEPGD